MLQPAKRNHPPTPTTNHSCMNNGKCEKYRIRCESDLNDYHVRFIPIVFWQEEKDAAL